METSMETKYETECRLEHDRKLLTEPRQEGYSHSNLVSVMVVLDCDAKTAKGLLDWGDDLGYLDWSEATWYEIRDYFVSGTQWFEKNRRDL